SIYAPHDIFPRTFESDKNPRLKKCPVFKVQDAFHCCLLAVGDDAVHHYLINAGGNIRQLCFLHDSFVQKHLVLLKHCCNSFDKEKLPWCIATPCRILDDNTICCFIVSMTNPLSSYLYLSPYSPSAVCLHASALNTATVIKS